jgi:hypothetical protein
MLSFSLIALALLANQHRQADRAASLLGASEAVRAVADIPLPTAQATFAAQAAAEAREALGNAAFEAAVATGRAWSVARAIAAAELVPVGRRA